MAHGATLDSTDKSDLRHMRFCLNLPDKCSGDMLESEWVNCTLMVNAAQFREAIQRLKAVIHSE